MNDNLGQCYNTPEMAIIDRKCDIIVVGRGIIKSDDPISKAIKYKEIAYNSYLKRLSSDNF
jgi:orotidine-5'-phosphate decarboxylase